MQKCRRPENSAVTGDMMNVNGGLHTNPITFGMLAGGAVNAVSAMVCFTGGTGADLNGLCRVAGILLIAGALLAFGRNVGFGFLVLGTIGFYMFCSGFPGPEKSVTLTFAIMFAMLFLASLKNTVPRMLSGMLVLMTANAAVGVLYMGYPDWAVFSALKGIMSVLCAVACTYLAFAFTGCGLPIR